MADYPQSKHTGLSRMFPRAAQLVASLFAQTVCGFAGELWSWHTFDATVARPPKTELILHARLRTGRSFGSPQQGRVGIVSKSFIGGGTTLIGGYYYGKEEDSADDWRNVHRLFGGMEIPLFHSRAVSVETRGIVERFFVREGERKHRYRHRFRLRTNREIGPYLGAECFLDANGYLSGRYAGGIRWRKAESFVLEVGYLYDARRASLGEPRHVITTQLTFDGLGR